MNAFLKFLVVTPALVLLGGCASDEPKPPVCESYDAVQNTVNHLRDANVSENGLTAVRPYVSQLLNDLNQLVADAKAQFSPQADQLRTSVQHLSTTVDTARLDPGVANLAKVRVSVSSVAVSARSLGDAISGTC
jgi:hypothetical protein